MPTPPPVAQVSPKTKQPSGLLAKLSVSIKSKAPTQKESYTPLKRVDPQADRTTPHEHPYLQGNYYPVMEETEGDLGIECEVVMGTLPPSLLGSMYIRTGPNSLHPPKDGKLYHIFDGDGMLHGTYFKDTGKGTIEPRYINRWVRSDLMQKSLKHGPMLFSLGVLMTEDMHPIKALGTIVYYASKSLFFRVRHLGNGNTSLLYHHKTLLALNESGAPVATEVPSLNTLGKHVFQEDTLTWAPYTDNFSAHPKVDPSNGDLIFYGYNFLMPPYVRYSVLAADGTPKVWQQPIPGIKKAVMMHDLCVSPTRTILMVFPAVLDFIRHPFQKRPLFAFEPETPARFAIIPRLFNAKKDKVIWFETEACMVLHGGTAWDELDDQGNVVAVCMTGCRSQRIANHFTVWHQKGVPHPPKEYPTPGSGRLHEQDPDATYFSLFRFDLKTGTVKTMTLSTYNTELPTINEKYRLRPDHRFVYLLHQQDPVGDTATAAKGILKLDYRQVIAEATKDGTQYADKENVLSMELGSERLLAIEEKACKKLEFGPGIYGNEASFVPALNSQSEDDGHLLVYVYDESQLEPVSKVPKKGVQSSELWVVDAKTMEVEAKVKIPRRIPYGFHGAWLSASQIQEAIAK